MSAVNFLFRERSKREPGKRFKKQFKKTLREGQGFDEKEKTTGAGKRGALSGLPEQKLLKERAAAEGGHKGANFALCFLWNGGQSQRRALLVPKQSLHFGRTVK